MGNERVLVDSNVLTDVISQDAGWGAWSTSALASTARSAVLVINAIIYAEVSTGFDRVEDIDALLAADQYRREEIPFAAAFLAAAVHRDYRRRGGNRAGTLPDFFIGAHAAVSGYRLLTRDVRRYRTYFPTVPLIAPPAT